MPRFVSFRQLVARLFATAARHRGHVRPPYRLVLEALETRLTPATTLSIADNSVLEPTPGGTVNLDFTVTRTGDLTSQITVGYTTVAGTAQPGTDFTPTTGTTTFASGSATATISIPVFGNGVYDSPSLNFSVQLTGVTNVVGPPITLANQATFATGVAPYSVAVGDVNGDGKPDLVAANDGLPGSVSVLLNTTQPGATTPSFAPQQLFLTGVRPTSVALGDVNGDGKPDITTCNFSDGTVSVLLNTTQPGAAIPSFATQQTFAVGTGPSSVALGDVNGDGRPDLAVANQRDGTSGTVSVLLNTTQPGAAIPSFATQQTFTPKARPISVALGDVNGDGRPDLVVANFGEDSVSVLLNTTQPGAITPSFATQQSFATKAGPFTVAVGDLNGDGRPDLITANFNDDTVSVLINTTAPGATVPSFAPQLVLDAGDGAYSVAVGDLNGDGKPDLTVANIYDYSVSVLLNTTPPGVAAPSFAPHVDSAAGARAAAVKLADVNGDGKPDVIVANPEDRTLSVLLNTTVLGASTIVPAFPQTAAPSVGTLPLAVAVADVNGDGKPDLVTANYGAATVSVVLNTTQPGAATPSFATQQAFGTGTEPRSVAVGDVNGDGLPDLLVANDRSDTVSVLLNTTQPGVATPFFATQQPFAAGSGPRSVTLADINGDGKPDLLIASHINSTVSVLLNTTALGAATASFSARQNFATGSSITYSLTVGDVNGDGKPDVVTVNQASNVNPSVTVLLNATNPGSSTAAFAAPQLFPAGSNPTAVRLADLNGDGLLDLALVNRFTSTASVLLNTTSPGSSTASFATQQPFGTLTGVYGVALGDVNGDGRPDLVANNSDNATVSVLLNTPVTLARATATGTITESDVQPTVRFATAAETVDANAGTFSITVSLTVASDLDTTVPFTLGGTAVADTDYSGVTASPLVIPAGQLTGTITGTLPDDGFYGDSADTTLTVTLGTPTNGALGTPATNTLTIHETTPRPDFPSLTPKQRFVQALYLDELGRPGSLTELDGWVAVLDGPGGAAAVVAGIKDGPEGHNHLIVTWYRRFLGRAAAPAEAHAWETLLNQGQAEERVLSQILGDTVNHEFYDRAQTLGSGETPDERYVQALYRLLLGRAADPGEVAAGVGALAQQGRQGVALGLLQGDEFRTDLFQGYYQGLLHRTTTAAELGQWVRSGLDASAVRGAFETGPEFFSNG